MWLNLIFTALFIIAARIVDVALCTFRLVSNGKGNKEIASFIGFFEATIFVSIFSTILSNINTTGGIIAIFSNPTNVLFIFSYAIGFAVGNYLGVVLENKIAMGNYVVWVTVKDKPNKLANYIRDNGFAATIIDGEARDGTVYLIRSAIKRKDISTYEKLIKQYEHNAFITVTDVRAYANGYFRTRK